MTEPLNRKQLYDLVWKKPMVEAAREYGLSDRGLAKLCERNGIPVPPRGYWARKRAGFKVVKPPLIVVDPKGPDTAVLLKQATQKPQTPDVEEGKEAPGLPEEIQEAMARELLPKNRVTVPKTLSNPHPIVAKWIAEEERRAEDYRRWGDRWSKPKKISALEQRRRRIISAFLKAMEARGFKAELENEYRGFIWIVHGRDRIGFSIEERIRQYRRELTPEEKKDSWRSNQKWTQTREPTGELTLRLSSDSRRSYDAKDFQENTEQKLEAQLNNVIAAVIEKIWWAKKKRLEHEEAERQRWQQKQEEWRQEELLKEEQERTKELEAKADNWKNAQTVRDYVAAVLKAAGDNQLDINADTLVRWKEWALAHAADLDPITAGDPLTDLAVGEVDKNLEEDFEEDI